MRESLEVMGSAWGEAATAWGVETGTGVQTGAEPAAQRIWRKGLKLKKTV